jgi:hypothetical protein
MSLAIAAAVGINVQSALLLALERHARSDTR